MKKMLVSLFLVAATVSAFAVEYTAKAKVVLSAGSQKSTLYLIQSNDLNEGVNEAWCGEIDLDEREIALYAIYDGDDTKKYESFGSKDLSKLTFGVKTNGSETYTITVSEVEGTETLVWQDATGTHPMTEGAFWSLTATEIAQAMSFYTAPGTPEICHQYDKLTVNNAAGSTVELKDMNDNVLVAAKTITATDNEIDLTAVAGLVKGNMYNVVWVNGEETKNLVIKY